MTGSNIVGLRRRRAIELFGLLGSLLLAFGTAAFGSQFTPSGWYAGIVKPSWTPPGWLFPPVWTFLYASMAVAAWLVWRRKVWSEVRPALAVYAGQLVLNGLWSWLFFGQHRIGVALADIALLFALIVITTVLFWHHVRVAGVLFVPYALWVGFATALNFRIWQLN